MVWAQIAIIVMFSMSAGMHLVKMGEPKSDNYGEPGDWIGMALILTLLYFAGAFDQIF